jgi:hypothetical protein
MALKSLIFISALLFSSVSMAQQEVAWTDSNCLRVNSVTKGSQDYLGSIDRTWKLKYGQPKFIYSANRNGCFLKVQFPSTEYTCTTSALFSDGREVWARVEQCAPSGNFTF